MSGILGSVVPILITFLVFRAVINIPKNTERIKSQTNKARTNGVSKSMHGGTAGSAGAGNSELSVRYTMEDRKHDWLAKQLADEKIAKKRMKEMFGFKDLHPERCDAQAVRNEHAANCDAHGIDTATK